MTLQRAAYLLLCLSSAFSWANNVPAVKRAGLTDCLSGSSVPFDVKGTNEWTQDVKPYNLRLPYTPAAIAVPKSVRDIKWAVACGVKHGVRISAKGGGHSYGSYGYGGEDGHLVIILDRMYGVTLKDGIAKVQPGARLGHVATELFKQGRRGIAHGSCPGVGIAGHVLHGGYGMASRTYGLTLDWLVGATVVLANSTVVHCSATENVDLFWALRGAGSSFGIVAEFEFKTFSVPTKVTPFSIELDWGRNGATKGISAFQELGMNAPKELNMQIYLAPSGQTIQGVWYGDRAGLNAALKPFLGQINAQISTASTMGWIEGLEHFSGNQELDQTRPYDMHSTFYTTSLMTKALTKTQIDAFVKVLFDNTEDDDARHSWYLLLDLHGGKNSAVTKVAKDATAYPHRDMLLLYQFSDSGSNGVYPNPSEGFELLQKFRFTLSRLMADVDWGMYANYIDTRIDARGAPRLYYRENLPRLRTLKGQLDPNAVFWNPQGVISYDV
ncbi:hypothetical protein G7046_g1975 [Stylonectria norvegica]|nr:hypothetical protein G7046_g1975 [Stylonectria norvegica]